MLGLFFVWLGVMVKVVEVVVLLLLFFSFWKFYWVGDFVDWLVGDFDGIVYDVVVLVFVGDVVSIGGFIIVSG